MRALTFAGLLHDDGRFELEPGFVVDGEPIRGEGELEVVVLRRGKKPVTVTRLVLEAPCAIPGDTPGERTIARSAVGLVAFPEDASGLRVIHEGTVLTERRVAAVATEFDVDWPVGETIGPGRQTVRWNASTEGCHAALGYSNDGGVTWTPLSLPGPEREITIDADLLPGGHDCYFQLLATDGFTTDTLRSKAFAVARKGWMLWILAPASDTLIETGEPLILVAQSYQLEERTSGGEEIRWTSSVDGDLGSGTRVVARLSPGKHRIMARANDVSSEIVVSVERLPGHDRVSGAGLRF